MLESTFWQDKSNSQKIINLKAPESANDAVNYKFMFDLLQDETVVVWQQAV